MASHGERRALLDKMGVAWQQPWIEVMRPYAVTGIGTAGALAAAGAAPDLVEFSRCGLLDYDDVFVHQRDALASVLSGRNLAVTAGTGSGKTESFLLPVISSILSESSEWSGMSTPGAPWWRSEQDAWTPQRADETGRLSGIRALVLYPMNALVEDQLVRLRKALDSEAARCVARRESWWTSHLLRSLHRQDAGSRVPDEHERGHAVTSLSA